MSGRTPQSKVVVSLVLAGCSSIDTPFDVTSGSATTSSSSAGGSSSETGDPDGPSVADLYAQARCTAIEACDCSLEPFATTAACQASMRARFLAVLDQLDTGTFDFSCLDRVLDIYETSSCQTHLEIRAQDLAPDCLLVFGDDAPGEPCQSTAGTIARGDTCGAGLRCVSTLKGRRCATIGSTDHVAAQGEACAVDHQIRAPCESGTYCDVAATDTCVPRIAVGTTCPSTAACESAAWCNATADFGAPVCEPRIELGSECTVTAACEPAACVDGACGRVVCHASTCTDAVAQACFVSDL